MQSTKHRNDFAETAEGQEVKRRLQEMADSQRYNTVASYNSDGVIYPDNLISFVDKHINYLIKHPSVDTNQYLANIRLMTLVR